MGYIPHAMSTPTPTRVQRLDPLAQELAVAILDVLRRAAADGRLAVTPPSAAAAAAAAAGISLETPSLPAAPPPVTLAPRQDSIVTRPGPSRSKLTDRFQLLGPTGGDAHGESFLGRETATGNDVVIRMLHKGFAGDPAFMHRFEAECTHMQSLTPHPHVVRVLANGVHMGQPYVVSESVKGRSIGDIVANGQPMPETDVLRLAEQVASALTHVRAEAGITHGDLRPAALLVAYSGIAGIQAANEVEQIKVADFIGPKLPWHELARVPGLACPFYVAPEQFTTDGEIDARSDLYSLGCIMFHLLTGRPPYNGTRDEVRDAHLAARVADPKEHVEGITEATRQIVSTCMATSRNDRFLNFQGFIVACQKALQAQGGPQVRSMRFLRKPMPKQYPTPRPQGSGTAVVSRSRTRAEQSGEHRVGTASVRKSGTETIRKPGTEAVRKPGTEAIRKTGSEAAPRPITESFSRGRFPTPLPQDLPAGGLERRKPELGAISERIMRKHRERRADADTVDQSPVESDTALIRRGQEPVEKAPATAATTRSGRRLGSDGKPIGPPTVLPAPASTGLVVYQVALVLLALAVVALAVLASGG